MTEHPNQDLQRQASRAGGAALALGAAGYAVAVIAYVLLDGQTDGTGAGAVVTLEDRVSHFQARSDLAEALWLLEMVAALLIASRGQQSGSAPFCYH